MKQIEYFKDGESIVDSIFAEWETQIIKNKDENLKRRFYRLQDSFAKFKIELIKQGYKGYFSTDL